MDVAVRSAVAKSDLRGLPARSLTELQVGARRLTAQPGSVLHREGEVAPHADLVLSGLVRVFVTTADGLRLTVHYARRGALLGVLSLFAGGYRTPVTTQAVVVSELLALRPTVVTGIADNDVRVANALLRAQNAGVISLLTAVAGTAPGTGQQRVARHVLDLAADGQQGSELAARTTVQELADALGSEREVVTGILAELRERGLVTPSREGITVTDADGLLAATGWQAGS